MTKIQLLSLGAAALFGPALCNVAGDDSPLATRFDDKTFVYGETMPINGMLDRWSSSPFAGIARRDDVQAFIRAVFTALSNEEVDLPPTSLEAFLEKASEALGLTDSELRELLGGRLAFGVSVADPTGFQKFLDDDDASGEEVLQSIGSTLTVILEHDNKRAVFEKAMAHLKKEAEAEDEDVKVTERELEGFTVFEAESEEKKNPAHHRLFLLDDRQFVASFGMKDAAAVVRQVGGKDSASTIADVAVFQLGSEALEDQDFLLVGRLDFLDTVVRAFLPKIQEGSDSLIQGGMMAPPLQILDLIRVDALRGYYYSWRTSDDGGHGVSGIEIEERDGLLNSLMAYVVDELPDLSFVPQDVTGVSAFNYDVGALLQRLDRLVPQVSPLWGNMYQAYKSQLSSASGIDLDAMIFQNLGDKVIVLNFEPTAAEASRMTEAQRVLASSQVIMVRLRDGNRLIEGIDRLLAAFGMDAMLEKADYQGATIYSSPLMAMQGQPQSIAITQDQIIHTNGNLDRTREILSLLAEPGNGFMRQPLVSRYFDDMSADTVGFSYSNLQKVLEAGALALRVAASSSGGYDEDGAVRPVSEIPAVPDLSDHPLFLFSKLVKTRYGYRQESTLKNPSE